MVNRDGYIRIKARGSNRDKYAHRVVIEKLLGEPIPPGMQVHHMDGVRSHNCPHNLILMPRCLNNFMVKKCGSGR